MVGLRLKLYFLKLIGRSRRFARKLRRNTRNIKKSFVKEHKDVKELNLGIDYASLPKVEKAFKHLYEDYESEINLIFEELETCFKIFYTVIHRELKELRALDSVIKKLPKNFLNNNEKEKLNMILKLENEIIKIIDEEVDRFLGQERDLKRELYSLKIGKYFTFRNNKGPIIETVNWNVFYARPWIKKEYIYQKKVLKFTKKLGSLDFNKEMNEKELSKAHKNLNIILDKIRSNVNSLHGIISKEVNLLKKIIDDLFLVLIDIDKDLHGKKEGEITKHLKLLNEQKYGIDYKGKDTGKFKLLNDKKEELIGLIDSKAFALEKELLPARRRTRLAQDYFKKMKIAA